MKTKLHILLILIIILNNNGISQIGTSIPQNRIVDWSTVGHDGNIPLHYGQVIDVKSIGAIGDGITDDSQVIQNAIDNSNPNLLTLIYFPEGNYKIDKTISIKKNNIVLKGVGPDYTQLTFYNSSNHNITIEGLPSINPIAVTGGNTKGSSTLTLASIPSINPGDYIELQQPMDVTTYCNIPNAALACPSNNQTIKQIIKVIGISGNTITLEDDLSKDYSLSNLIIKTFNPIQNIGIEDLKLIEFDQGKFITVWKPFPLIVHVNNDNSGHKINFKNVANAWVSGVESEQTSSHHIAIYNSAKIEIRGSYLHHSYHYFNDPKGNTDGYGVYVGLGSSNCLIENNILVNLRHPIVTSVSANRNVFGYNFTNESKACGEGECQSDVVVHGYYPYANLFEGNSVNYMDVDVYWGLNGPYNTFFRNKMNKLEIREADFFNLVGNPYQSNFYANPPNILVIPNPLTDISYYHKHKPGFISSYYSWPLIGGSSLSNINPAEFRYNSGGQFTINKRDQQHGYSIQNTGLFTGLNSINGIESQIYRNKNQLSIGKHQFYSNSNNSWDIGPMCSYIEPSGYEKIISSYHDNSGNAVIYISDKDGVSHNIIFNKANCKITALTSGDFNGDGTEEIVLAYLHNGKPKVYKSNDAFDIEQILIYSKSNAYWSIDALTTGDFDGDNDVELIVGFNSSGSNTTIYKNEDANSVGSAIYSHTSGYWKIGGLTCGDFDGDGDDELISGLNSVDGPSIFKSEDGLSIGNDIYSGSNYWNLVALTGGDLDGDGDDELVTGFNSIHEGPAIYKSEDATKVCSVPIYDKINTYWALSSLMIEKQSTTDDEVVISESSIEQNNLTNFDKSGTSSNFSLYPNPTSNGNVFIKTNFEDEMNFTLQVYNVNGRLLLEKKSNKGLEKINVDEYSNGIYFIKLTTKEKTYQKKLILNKK